MTKNFTNLFLIKSEPREVEYNQFKLGFDELDDVTHDESSNEQEQSVQKDLNDKEIIKNLKQKIQKLENKLVVVAYRFKVKHAESVLIRNKQVKTINSLTKENLELNQKLNQFNELTGNLEKLCSNFKSLNSNKNTIIESNSNVKKVKNYLFLCVSFNLIYYESFRLSIYLKN